jgi:hypothetical protein
MIIWTCRFTSGDMLYHPLSYAALCSSSLCNHALSMSVQNASTQNIKIVSCDVDRIYLHNFHILLRNWFIVCFDNHSSD